MPGTQPNLKTQAEVPTKSMRALWRKYSTASTALGTIGSGNLSLAQHMIFDTINENIKVGPQFSDDSKPYMLDDVSRQHSIQVQTHRPQQRDETALRINERARLNPFQLFWHDLMHKQTQMRHKIKEVPILNDRIKHIEGFFGTSVTSFFIFLRWVIVLNFWLSCLWVIFVILPMSIRYDYSANDRIFHLRNLIDGQDAVEISWLFFGGYSNKLTGYSMDLAYITVILITYFGSLFLIFRSIAAAIQLKGDKKKDFFFSLMVFTYWDYSLCHPKGVADLNMGIANAMRDGMSEMVIEEKFKSRTQKEMYQQYAMRTLAWFITLILAAGGMGVVVWVVLMYDLESHAVKDLGGQNSLLVTYSVPFTFSIINSLVPACIRQLPKMESYLDGKLELNVTVARTFLFRMSTLFTLVATIFLKVKNVQRVICTGTLLGQQMYRIVITDTIIDALAETVYSLGLFLWYDEKLPFNMSYPVLMVVHKQAVIWTGMIVCPILPLAGLVSMYCYFMFMSKLLPVTCTTPLNRWSQSRKSVFFNTILGMTLFVLIIGVSVIIGSDNILDITNTNRDNVTCGPFHAETPILTFSVFIDTELPVFLQKFVNTIASVAVMLPVTAVLIAVLYYQQLRIKTEKDKAEDLQLEIEELTLEKKDLLRNNRLMKKLTNATTDKRMSNLNSPRPKSPSPSPR